MDVVPKLEWFLLDPYHPHHGLAHTCRVVCLADAIAQWMIEEEQARYSQAGYAHDVPDPVVVHLAAVVHDLRRADGSATAKHAFAAADWFMENLFGLVEPTQAWEIQRVVRWHASEYDVPPLVTTELICLKDADSLDRVRFMGPDTLDERYLRTTKAKALVVIARALCERTYHARSWDEVASVAKELGL